MAGCVVSLDMAKGRKKAHHLTTHEVLNRVFGKGAAKKLHAVLEKEDAEKGQRKQAKSKKR